MKATLFHRLYRECRGVALIEFVFVMPILILLVFGAVELSRYILITQRVEKAGYVLGDTLSQYSQTELTKDHVNQVFDQYKTILDPYDDDTKQRVIFTSVTNNLASHQVRINWQVTGGGSLGDSNTNSVVDNMSANKISTSPPPAGTPANWSGNSDIQNEVSTMWDGENMVVCEVFYRYTPILTSVLNSVGFSFQPATLVRRTYFHPRNGDLTNAPS